MFLANAAAPNVSLKYWPVPGNSQQTEAKLNIIRGVGNSEADVRACSCLLSGGSDFGCLQRWTRSKQFQIPTDYVDPVHPPVARNRDKAPFLGRQALPEG
jgi:hypothetical protein